MTDQRNGGIAWCDESWNPIRGCSRVSEGCRNCYAEKVAGRFSGPGLPYEGLVTIGEKGPRWNGAVRLVPERLADPLRWRKPRRIFVNSMSDLFHDEVPFEFIAAVFGVMAATPRHTFQVLTKRPKRALEFFEWVFRMGGTMPATAVPGGDGEVRFCVMHADDHDVSRGHVAYPAWPLPNAWLGVSAENQAAADERIPLLLQCPAAVRWVSAEPLLGPINFARIRVPNAPAPPFTGHALHEYRGFRDRLDWVIVGGESGPGARPMEAAWVCSIQRQCEAARVPFFFKQWGGVQKSKHGRELDGRTWDEFPEVHRGS